jgi:subtilisin-like proprotein convertase family protein
LLALEDRCVPATYNAVSPQVPLDFTDGSTITSTIPVTDQVAGTIVTSATVSLTITNYPNTGDLRITLIAPDGTTSVVMFDQEPTPGGGDPSNPGLGPITFDDTSGNTLSSGDPPYSGTFAPDSPLSAVVGQSANGAWQLQVEDLSTNTPGTDNGTLTAWSLTIGTDPPPAVTAQTFTATEGAAVTGVTVATFTDANPALTQSDFTANIDWGDGDTSPGTVTSDGGGGFIVTGDKPNNYAEEGRQNVTVTVSDPSGATGSGGVTETVGDAALTATATAVGTQAVGVQFSGEVATFADANPIGTLSDFPLRNVSIAWGDGSTTHATSVTQPDGVGTPFHVFGKHTYTTSGVQAGPLQVTVTDVGGAVSNTTNFGPVHVAADKLTATGVQVIATDGFLFSGEVASVTSSSNTETPADFPLSGIVITWGDGTSSNATSVVRTGGPGTPFIVTGSHTYLGSSPVTGPVTVTITDSFGATSNTTSVAPQVFDAPLFPGSGIPVTAVKGVQVTGVALGTFFDADPSGVSGNYTVSIAWGDGTTSSGSVAPASGGGFEVFGTKPSPYKAIGPYTITATVTDFGGSTTTVTTSTTVTSIDIFAVGNGQGGQTQVSVYDADTGLLKTKFIAFDPSLTIPVTVATGDVNGDGVPDVVVAAGKGGGPQVKVIDGTKLDQVDSTTNVIQDSALLASFYAFKSTFTGGVSLALGHFDNGPGMDVVTGSGAGTQPQVHVYAISGGAASLIGGPLGTFTAFNMRRTQGVTVAAGDVNGDGKDDLIVGTQTRKGAVVSVFDATGAQLASFMPYGSSKIGVYVAAGDVDGDGRAEIITGAGQGGSPVVNVYDVNASGGGVTLVRTFDPYDQTFTGGVRVAAPDLDGNGKADILTGSGPGLSQVNGYLGSDSTELVSINALNTSSKGGVYVG